MSCYLKHLSYLLLTKARSSEKLKTHVALPKQVHSTAKVIRTVASSFHLLSVFVFRLKYANILRSCIISL